jgi:hypothetical protein
MFMGPSRLEYDNKCLKIAYHATELGYANELVVNRKAEPNRIGYTAGSSVAPQVYLVNVKDSQALYGAAFDYFASAAVTSLTFLRYHQ